MTRNGKTPSQAKRDGLLAMAARVGTYRPQTKQDRDICEALVAAGQMEHSDTVSGAFFVNETGHAHVDGLCVKGTFIEVPELETA